MNSLFMSSYLIYDMKAETLLFDRDALEFIQRRKLGGVYVDVGSKLGQRALFFLNRCRSFSVVCIDGDPCVRQPLSENIRKGNSNGKPAWFLHCFLSSHKNVFFNQQKQADHVHTFLSETRVTENSEKAQAVALDEFALLLPRIDLLYLNVDNHELEVITSARQTLARYRPELCIEVHDDGIPALRDRLLDWGYFPLQKKFTSSRMYFIPVNRVFMVMNNFIDCLPLGKRTLRNILLNIWSLGGRIRRNLYNSGSGRQLPQEFIQLQ